MMGTLLISGLVFVSITTAILGVGLMLQTNKNTELEKRLATLTCNPTSSKGQPATTSVLAQPLKAEAGFGHFLSTRFVVCRLFLEQANSPWAVQRILVITVGLAVGGLTIGITTLQNSLLACLLASLSGVLPWSWLYVRRHQRLQEFGRQLPQALDLISRALRAGHSLSSGFELVSSELPDPISSEFRRCYEEQNLGIPFDDAVKAMAKRVPDLDLRFLATALILQRQTGGDLAEVLDKIADLIRGRFKLRGQIQALTGEGRLSGIVLLALPPVLFLVMYYMNPAYCRPLFDDPLGQQMLMAAVASQIVGALVIRKIINIKV